MPFNRPLLVSLTLRLVLAPVLGYGIARLIGAEGILAESLVVATSFPTAVNSALLALEFDNEPQFAAAAVFYSTLVSSLTVTVVIFAARQLVS